MATKNTARRSLLALSSTGMPQTPRKLVEASRFRCLVVANLWRRLCESITVSPVAVRATARRLSLGIDYCVRRPCTVDRVSQAGRLCWHSGVGRQSWVTTASRARD